MSLENFDGGDAKDQNYVKGAKKRHDETPKKIQLDRKSQLYSFLSATATAHLLYFDSSWLSFREKLSNE